MGDEIFTILRPKILFSNIDKVFFQVMHWSDLHVDKIGQDARVL